jgi:hypothetical protein
MTEEEPPSTTGPLARIAALGVALMATLVNGILGGLVEAFRRAFGLGTDDEDDEPRA